MSDNLNLKVLSELKKLLHKYQIYYCQKCYDLVIDKDLLIFLLLHEYCGAQYDDILTLINCTTCGTQSDAEFEEFKNKFDLKNDDKVKSLFKSYNSRLIKYKDELRALNYLIQIDKELQKRENG